MNKIDLCKTIQANVSKLTDSENLELFKIILDTNANYTKNNNGIFLNLNWIEEELLHKINSYILFCIKSQNEISKYELMKTLLNDSINTKENNGDEEQSISMDNNAANTEVQVGTSGTVINTANQKQKFSSSMKFYLLKKKFQKQQLTANIESYLTHDEYIISS
jgi:hypothetical protein